MKRIYVAGPYTSPDVAVNVKRAMDVTNELLGYGFQPFCPHLSHFLHMASPQPYETWMELDLAWLEQCEALVRLPGASPGADREVARAQQIGMPVFRSLGALIQVARALEAA